MRHVLVTGAGRGLGLEFVRQCVARGDRVFAGVRRPEHAAELQELKAKHPNQVELIPRKPARRRSVGDES